MDANPTGTNVRKWLWLWLVIAAAFFVELVHNATNAGLREGREQACARLAPDENPYYCGVKIEKDVALDERVTKQMGNN
jgi:hypothetical protein